MGCMRCFKKRSMTVSRRGRDLLCGLRFESHNTKNAICQLVCYHVTVSYTQTVQGPTLVAKVVLRTSFGCQILSWCAGTTFFKGGGTISGIYATTLTHYKYKYLCTLGVQRSFFTSLLSAHPQSCVARLESLATRD